MARKTRSSGVANPKTEQPSPDRSSEINGASEPDTQNHHAEPSQTNDRRTISKTTLQFDQQLAAKPGKPIALATLLERLDSLSTELKSLDQGENDERTPTGLTAIATQLAQQSLLGHKDRGVRALTAQCIVDILRLCAPDAPFTGPQLKAIFEMIVRQILPALADVNDAYNSKHLYILDSLATVKSIVLVTDLDSADRLILDIFTTFFDTLSDTGKSANGERLGKSVELHMMEILILLVDEASAIPPGAVEIVMAQFLRAVDPRSVNVKGLENKSHGSSDYRQTILKMTSLPPAYNLAKSLCNSCATKMTREVGQYFSDIISAAADLSESRRMDKDLDDDGNPEDLEEEEFEQLKKAHRLLKELWRACPLVLQNVIPPLEAELGVGNTLLRLLATETIGDMVAGVGPGGFFPIPKPDPIQYPPSITQEGYSSSSDNTTLQPFIQIHPNTYATFLKRWQDKSPTVRASWTACIGRILATSAGGIGLSSDELDRLLQSLARMMNDADERVRQAAVSAVGAMSTHDVILKLGLNGGVDTPGSVLGNLSERIKDKKPTLRREAMRTLATLWASASLSIAEGENDAVKALGGVVSKILNTVYTNDPEIVALVDEVMFEILVPLSFPHVKSKSDTDGLSAPQQMAEAADTNVIRANRILLLASSLDEKAKKIFFSFGQRQTGMMRYLSAFIQGCEQYNGGVSQGEDTIVSEKLSGLINGIAKTLPSSSRASSDLWKFATTHDKRCYYLIRFCMNYENDYKSVVRAIKECLKRMAGKGLAQAGKNETFKILFYRISILFYNKSHLPTMLQAAKEINAPFAKIADDIVRDVSIRVPEVLKANVSEMCKSVQERAPKSNANEDLDLDHRAAEDLKTLAAFATKFPSDLAKDNKFQQAMIQYCLLGMPSKCAKYACKVAFSISTRKELLARDLLTKCLKDLEYGKTGFLARMATIAQICLLSPKTLDGHVDTIFTFAIHEVLNKTRTPSDPDHAKPLWDAEMDVECEAKCWALKILVNLIRSSDETVLSERAPPIYTLLKTIVIKEGELSIQDGTPPAHKARLRLLAANSLVKLSRSQYHDALLDATAFNKLAEVVQDPLYEIRSGFVHTVEKYLSTNRVPRRFYTILFLLAWEPIVPFRTQTATWIRARVAAIKNLVSNSQAHENDHSVQLSTVFEGLFPRLLSLLAHHPDFDDTPEDLLELSKYLVFYLTTVSSKENISLIYHLALQVKNHVDVISTTKSFIPDDTQADYTQRLHVLSDLATVTCRSFADVHSWNIQTMPIKAKLPSSLFLENKDHASSLQTAETLFIPETLSDQIDALIRTEMKRSHATKVNGLQNSRKRKSEGAAASSGASKKQKKASEANSRKHNKKVIAREADTASEEEVSKDQAVKDRAPQSRRRSSRVQRSQGQVHSYVEASDSEAEANEDDEE